MNFILKIIQGPNAGAEIALVAGTTVSFGRGESCDIVLGDQMLPEKAGELVVEEAQVVLTLPDGTQEPLAPLHVRSFETTAIAVGPADAPWGELVWPKADAKPAEAPKPETAPAAAAAESAEAPKPETAPPAKGRRLQLALLVVLVLIVVLEFLVWFFWPQLNVGMMNARIWWQQKSEKWFADKRELAARPYHRQTVEELAAAFGVEAVLPAEGSAEAPKLRGNLRRRAERLQLIALAYNAFPGIELDLSDDESLRASSEELLHIVTEDAVKVVSAADRKLELAGHLESPQALRRMLEAIQADVNFAESVDCSQVTLPVVAQSVPVPPVVEVSDEPAAPLDAVVPAAPAVVAPQVPRLPVVGVLMTPYPCLVMRDGSRVLEGADFHGFLVSKITEDAVVLKQGDFTLEWKP